MYGQNGSYTSSSNSPCQTAGPNCSVFANVTLHLFDPYSVAVNLLNVVSIHDSSSMSNNLGIARLLRYENSSTSGKWYFMENVFNICDGADFFILELMTFFFSYKNFWRPIR